MPNTRDKFEIIKELLSDLTGPDVSFKPIRNALRNLSEDFCFARIISILDVAPKPPYTQIKHLEDVLFTDGKQFNHSNPYVFNFTTSEPSKGCIKVYAKQDHNFTPEECDFLDVLVPIIQIYCGRYKMIQRAENEYFVHATTGLPNVNGFMRSTTQKYRNNTLKDYDAYYFNLKNFGLVNKNFGTEEGTEVLKRYAVAVLNTLEPDEVLGHLGGDNFVALIHKGENSEKFRKLLTGIPIEATRPDGTKEKILLFNTVGVMNITENTPVDLIISGPAIAYNWAKRQKLPLVVLTDNLTRKVNRDKYIEQNFEKFLAKEEFIVFYQPKVNSLTGEIVGTEALCRWIENGVVVPPFDFIPVLEQSGKIVKLDLYMLEIVCQNISVWKSKGNKAVPASINFSRRDLSDPDLAEKILEIIKKYNIEKSEIVIEVTETTNEEEQGQMSAFLNKLKEYGIDTSIDDFGTGYSSLSSLREFPVSEIKIDRSFINRKLDKPDEIIIQSIINMAHDLGIEVITEGVENISQKNFLHQLGCNRVQGFLYDKPLPKEEFEERMKRGRYEIPR